MQKCYQNWMMGIYVNELTELWTCETILIKWESIVAGFYYI